MKDTEFAYASARIRSDENGLLGLNFLTNLAEERDCTAAVSALINQGYYQLEETSNRDEAFEECMSELWAEVKACVNGKACFDFLIIKNDFYNLKAVIKGIVSNNPPEKLFLRPCVFDPNEMYEFVKARNFDLLDPIISEAAERGYKLITETMDGQIFDICIDRYYYSTLLEQSCDYPFAYEYFSKQLAMYDIRTALRIAETGKTADAVLDAVFDSNLIDVGMLKRAAKKSVNDVLSYVESTEFSSLAEAYRTSNTAMERECASILASVLEKARLVSFGTEPIFAYFIVKENEINTVRMILNCIDAKIPAQKICERMCVSYV